MLIVISSDLIMIEWKLAYMYKEYSKREEMKCLSIGEIQKIKFKNFFSEALWTSLFLLAVQLLTLVSSIHADKGAGPFPP